MDEIRPIDANALKKKINAFYDKLFVGCVSSDLITYASGVDEIIDTAPTINPEKKLQTPSCLMNPERQAELLERYKEE